METTRSASAPPSAESAERRSRQHLGVRMGQGFRDAIADMHDRQQRGYADIAVELGFVDASSLCHILAGRRGVSTERAAHIATILGKPIEELRETSS